ncbi:MAG: zinc-ribbon domain containing protein [Rhabdochlamydiaceae bacterium]
METRKCIDCNEEFTVLQEETDFINKKGFIPRKRCKSCVAKNKAQKHLDGKL